MDKGRFGVFTREWDSEEGTYDIDAMLLLRDADFSGHCTKRIVERVRDV